MKKQKTYYTPIDILLDYANGKGFDIIDGGGACLDYINLHTFCKFVSNIEYIAREEKNQEVLDMCNQVNKDIKGLCEDMSKANKPYRDLKEIQSIVDELPLERVKSILNAKKKYDDAGYLASNLVNHDKSIGIVANLHSLEKLTAELEGEANRSDLPEVEQLAKRLQNALDDVYKIMSGKVKIDNDFLLKKYSHNITSVIKDNDMILTLKNGIADKNLIGNKGANLVEMHKLGINVPESLFLTTVACKSIYEQQEISFMPLLKNILYMFNTDLIAIRSSGVVSMAGMMDTVLDVNKNDTEAVTKAIMDVVNSWGSERAKSFRKVCKMSDEIKVAIVIQPVIRGDKGCSGIVFSRNPNNGNPELTGEYIEKSLGDKLASGEVTPKNIREFNDTFTSKIFSNLCYNANKLEKYFKAVQDIEFVNDGEKTYFIQTRNAQLTPLAKIKTLIGFYNEGIIDLNEFKKRYNPEIHKKVTSFEVSGTVTPSFKGTPAVNGVFTGTVTFKKEKATKDNILIVDNTSPDDMPYLKNIGALITKIGGMTSHPAVVCRQMNIPCVVGAKTLTIDERIGRASFDHSIREIHEGDTLTIIGDTGEVYEGKCEVKQKQLFVGEVNEILNNNG